MSETKSMSAELVTMLTVHILIDGKDTFPDGFRNEEIAKGVLVSGTQVEPRSAYALNKTTFLVTYPSGIWAEDIGSAIKKINEWIGKLVVITCDEVTAVPLSQVIEPVHHTTGVESVEFNTRIDDMKSSSNPSVHSGYHTYTGSQAVLWASVTTFLNKMPGILWFSGTEREREREREREKYTVRFEQWLHSISDARKNFNDQWVRAAINKSCVGDVADAICCLPPGATLDDIIKKFKWMYGSVESFDALMQEFYPIVQGKSERVQSSVLHLEWALKAIKQQHPHTMTEEKGVKHLKN